MEPEVVGFGLQVLQAKISRSVSISTVSEEVKTLAMLKGEHSHRDDGLRVLGRDFNVLMEHLAKPEFY
jgi:hypothetical protein